MEYSLSVITDDIQIVKRSCIKPSRADGSPKVGPHFERPYQHWRDYGSENLIDLSSINFD